MGDNNRIFQAITRPSERAGMPMSFHIFALSIPLMLFILTQSIMGFWALLSVAPSYLLARWIVSVDPYLPDHLATMADCKLFTKNKPFWGGNSYAGD
ncbi:VirB3 family type IV secretion system protein [Ruegeria sp. EL01]|uniref:VirB3 family type IV secretion system protein n=1 Tax=Ruegeria sp. EL01 TaxID=2107578 RepID=UPI0013C3F90C|nr:VirB3 family type IV secretion system protein [Ruegeria sp. EL01]